MPVFFIYFYFCTSLAFVLMWNDHNFLYKNMYCHLLNGVSPEKHQENDNTQKSILSLLLVYNFWHLSRMIFSSSSCLVWNNNMECKKGSYSTSEWEKFVSRTPFFVLVLKVVKTKYDIMYKFDKLLLFITVDLSVIVVASLSRI